MQYLSSLLLLAASAQAHYRFPKLIINGQTDAAEWTNVRQTRNYQTNQGVTDVNSADMRCYQMKAGSGTATIAAGDTLGFAAAASISHFGPVQLYMARVPDSANINTWEASGNVWFKAGSIDAIKPASGTFTSDETTWPAYKKTSVEFKIPASLPAGYYLARIESIALHQASSAGGAQIYLSCAQIKVTGGGNGTPGPLVAFPGAYKTGEAGLIWSYYPIKTSYTAPGPPVWQG